LIEDRAKFLANDNIVLDDMTAIIRMAWSDYCTYGSKVERRESVRDSDILKQLNEFDKVDILKILRWPTLFNGLFTESTDYKTSVLKVDELISDFKTAIAKLGKDSVQLNIDSLNKLKENLCGPKQILNKAYEHAVKIFLQRRSPELLQLDKTKEGLNHLANKVVALHESRQKRFDLRAMSERTNEGLAALIRLYDENPLTIDPLDFIPTQIVDPSIQDYKEDIVAQTESVHPNATEHINTASTTNTPTPITADASIPIHHVVPQERNMHGVHRENNRNVSNRHQRYDRDRRSNQGTRRHSETEEPPFKRRRSNFQQEAFRPRDIDIDRRSTFTPATLYFHQEQEREAEIRETNRRSHNSSDIGSSRNIYESSRRSGN